MYVETTGTGEAALLTKAAGEECNTKNKIRKGVADSYLILGGG